MPIPTPKGNESEDTFMGHCMGNGMMMEDFPDEKQRFAVCKGKWDEHKEKKSDTSEVEKRSFSFCLETRDTDSAPVLRGHAAIFNTEAEIIPGPNGFREMIRPGAFREAITTDDVRALFNHDPNFVLGRNKAGTLNLSEDERGLAIEINPPDTQFARDLMVLMKRGDISQMSFGFRVQGQRWEQQEGKSDLRVIEKVKLFDVSPVTYPAYEGTDVAVRSHIDWRKEKREKHADYIPKSIHESLTWHLNLPIDASASEIAEALKEVVDGLEDGGNDKHPDSHMILVKAINSPSDSEKDALKTLQKVAEGIAGEMMKEPEMKTKKRRRLSSYR